MKRIRELKSQNVDNASTNSLIVDSKIKKETYDFYRYINQEYDLKEYPELIQEHFAFLLQNSEKVNEIPKKYGKWNIARIIDRKLMVSSVGNGAIQEIAFEFKSLRKLLYIFDITGMLATFGKQPRKTNYNFGYVTIQIEFDNISPHYCAQVDLHFDDEINDIGKNMIGYIMGFISEVLDENGFGDTFLVASEKSTPIVIRECMTRKIHYFVIPNTENNKPYWDNEMYEIRKNEKRKMY